MKKMAEFRRTDLADFRRRKLSPADIRRQLRWLRTPPAGLPLLRACVLGDGIVRLSSAEKEKSLRQHESLASAGRLTKFVPASGAASRMFKDVVPGAAVSETASVRAWMQIRRSAVFAELDRYFRRRRMSVQKLLETGRVSEVVEALVSSNGLSLLRTPKALVPFHRYSDGTRAAFEEHLVEAAMFVRDRKDICRVHFTVSPEHRSVMTKQIGEASLRWGRILGCRFHIEYSVQSQSSNTVALNGSRHLFRDASGRLLFRPGGHGALLENLNECRGDIVHIKNIDNVVPDRVKSLVCQWQKYLVGYLGVIQDEIFGCISALEEDSVVESLRAAETLCFTKLFLHRPKNFNLKPLTQRRAYLLSRLKRPLRVCSVVENKGEPGGGPFWVRDREGIPSLRIVEQAEMVGRSAFQKRIFLSGRYFNPVNMICGLRDRLGRPFDLREYSDPMSVIVTRKTEGDSEVTALEWPGLWNGGMADWNTIFVECPEKTFSPVKTIADLCRPEHQA